MGKDKEPCIRHGWQVIIIMEFETIAINSLNENAIKLIGEDWGVIATKVDGKINAMTISWGGLGVMWGQPVAFVFIRPQRFTKTLIDKCNKFTLSFFGKDKKKVLSYLGSASGANEDKIVKSGLETVDDGDFVYFKENELVLECCNLFAQNIKEESFIDYSPIEKWYPQKDFHCMYIAKIEKALKKN